MNYVLLGKNIARMRVENHLTQEQLAEAINVSAVFVSQIETAVRKPSLETVYKLSLALNTTIDTLIGNEGLQARCDEISGVLQDKSDAELRLITDVVKEISRHLRHGKIV